MIQSRCTGSRYEEGTPLIPSHNHQQANLCSRVCCQQSPLSKAIFIILVWTVIVGEMYTLIHVVIAAFIGSYVPMGVNHLFNALSSPLGFVSAILAAIAIFYPLSGFIADVWCGKFKIIIISLTTILFCNIIVAITFVIWFSLNDSHKSMVFVMLKERIPLYITGFGAAFFIILGYAAYQANFIQFGLDQLMEAPSTSLSVFIHWAIWADTLGATLVTFAAAVVSCPLVSAKIKYPFLVVPLFPLLCLPVLLILACWKHHWFYIEPNLRNPYRMVISILNFVRKHKYPLHRSAFTYSDVDHPSRIDFAKQRFGGPYTTEQVEDVKAFLRILLLLVIIGPVFGLEIPTGSMGFLAFGMHTGYSEDFLHRCSIWALLESGMLRYVIGSIFIPVYMHIQFSLLKWSAVSRIFIRLFIGVILWILGALSMLVIDLVGHFHSVNDQGLGSYCMFKFSRDNNAHALLYPVLEMHWAVLIAPSILLGIGPPIVVATMFEFISAQSPSSMKGFLIGVFFAIRGIFQLISSLILFPFSSDKIWSEGYMKTNPPVTNCGFGYLLSISVIAMIGLILFAFVARRYKYRERDDRPYDYYIVEDIFDRRNRMRPPSLDYDDYSTSS